MPNKPVIQVEVDDERFRAFREIFDHYRQDVDEMPEAWKKANTVMNAGLAAIAEQTHAFNHNLQTAITAQHQFAKATNVSAHGMKTMAKYAKETYEHIFNMGKFVLKAGAWGGGLLAGATFGLDKLANSVLTPGFGARGVNTDSGLYRAFQLDYARLAPAGMLSATWAAQQDPSKYPYLAAAAGLSINAVQRMNPVALDKQMMLAAHDYFQSNRNNPNAFMPEMPQMQGFSAAGLSLEDVTRLGNTSRQELQLRGQMMAADAQSLRYSQKTQDAMWTFQRQLQLAGSTIVTALATDLTPVVKALTPTFKALGEDANLLINDALAPKNIKLVQDAIGSFTKYLDSGQAKADITAFVSGVEAMATTIVAAVRLIDKWMGITPGKKAPGTPVGPRENFTFNADRQAQMEAVRRGYGGNTFLADFKSWQTLSDQIGVNPAVAKVRGMAEKKYGLLPGTLAADAQAESGNYLFAINGNMAGWYQMSPAARKDFGVANPYDPLSSSVGEAAQLASNLALARKLNPTGTMLQHAVMQKAANILGNAGFTRFWQKEEAAHRTNDFRVWQRDLPKDDQADIRRFVTALPRSVFSRLLADDHAGQIDTGADKTLKSIAGTLLRIEKNTGRSQPSQSTRSTPIYRSVPILTNAAR